METFADLALSTLPMTVLVFVGSYFGVWKSNEHKLPEKEAVILFLALWIITAILIVVFRILLASQDELTQSTVGYLWWVCLIVGIVVGRNIANWRRKVNAQKQSAGSVLLKKTSVQYLLVSGACVLLYYLTFNEFWPIFGLIYAVVMLLEANRRAGGPVDFGGNGGGNGG